MPPPRPRPTRASTCSSRASRSPSERNPMLHLGPADGRLLNLDGAEVLVKVGPPHTQDRFAFLHARNEPGWHSELNRHPRQSKLFFVLEGSYDCYGDGRWLTVAAGDTLLVPAGTTHGFRAGADGGRVLVVYPGDSVGWFTGAADHVSRGVES